MKKKILVLSMIVLFITSFSTVNVLAANITSAQITITTSNTEYHPGDTIEFIISLKDLNADRGISGLGAVIEYDSNLLELKYSAKGCTNWESASIGSESNRFATTRNRDEQNSPYSQNNEDIITIQFTVKEVTSETTTKVSLKNIELSNGSLYRIENAESTSITIKPKTTTPIDPDDSDEPDNPDTPDDPVNPTDPSNPTNPDIPTQPDNPNNSNGNGGVNNNQGNENHNSNIPNGNNSNGSNNNNNSNNNASNKDPNIKNEIIPQLGEENLLSIIVITIVCAIFALMFGVKILLLNKKIKK